MILFLVLYLFSFHIVVGGYDWFMIWLGLEINMMMFIVIVYSRYNMINVESCFKYFFVQSLGSAMFMALFYLNKEFLDSMICLVLGYKVGAGPFFFWFPSVCSGISWMSCYLLMSVQKIIPLVLMSMFVTWVMFFIIIISLIVGVFGSFNQKDLKRLVAYSSIYHLGWILLCILMDSSSWMNYLTIYMMMIFPVMFFMKNADIMDLLEMIKSKMKLWLTIMMLSMAGMPPFLGFFLKWFAFVKIVYVSMFYMVVLVISSVVMFYVYFRVVYDILMGYSSYGGWGNWSEVKSKKVWLDVLGVLGMLSGFVISLYLLM